MTSFIEIMTHRRVKSWAHKQGQAKALQALQSASADEVWITQFPDGSILIKVVPHAADRKRKAISVTSVAGQRQLLDRIPADQGTEDSEEWIRRIQESRIDTDHIPLS